MFENWLVTPNNVVSWAFYAFYRYGPLPIILCAFVVLVMLRPRIPRDVPMYHRRALVQTRWTSRVGMAFALLGLIPVPSILQTMRSSDAISKAVFNGLFVNSALVVGSLFLVPYIFSVHIWFPRPVGWIPNPNWQITPRVRIRAWIAIIVLWVLNLVVLGIHAMFFLVEGSSINGPEVISTVAFFAVVGMFFMLVWFAVQYKISARPPVPGVPLSIDMERRREDLDLLQRFFTVFLGAAVAKCFQYAAQVQYETAPFWLASFSFIIAWAVSLGSLGLALMPGWWLMRNLDPAQQLMNHIEDKVLNEKRSPDIYSFENFTSALELDVKVTVKGSVRNQRDPFFARLLKPGSREQLTAPGTGSAPEEVSAGYTYIAKVAARVGVPLTHEEMNELSAIRAWVREVVENRVAYNEGAASMLVMNSEETAAQQSESVPVSEAEGEATQPLPDDLANLLGQSKATVAIGLDSQTVSAWKSYEEEQAATERYHKQLKERRALEQQMLEAYGYGFGYGFGYGYGMEGYGYDPFYPGYMDPYGMNLSPYGMADPYAGLAGYGAYHAYAPYGSYDAYGSYGAYGGYSAGAGTAGYAGYPSGGAYGANPYGAGAPDPYGMSTLDPYDINAGAGYGRLSGVEGGYGAAVTGNGFGTAPYGAGVEGGAAGAGASAVAGGAGHQGSYSAVDFYSAYGMYPGQDPNFDAFVQANAAPASPDVGHGVGPVGFLESGYLGANSLADGLAPPTDAEAGDEYVDPSSIYPSSGG